MSNIISEDYWLHGPRDMELKPREPSFNKNCMEDGKHGTQFLCK